MATTSQTPLRFFASLSIIATTLFFTTSFAEIRFKELRSDGRSTIPFDEFGFTPSGRLELNVSGTSLSIPDADLSQVGFLLCTRDSCFHVLEQVIRREIKCPLNSDLIKRVFTFDKLQNADRYDTIFTVSDANQFTLVFANCVPNLKVSMNVRSSMYNLDAKTDRRDYLSAGITLFTLIMLIGTGLSFLKPYLQAKEKKVLMIVIPLQVIANVVIDEAGLYGQDSYTLKQVFLLVDVICCCAVLFPIVWSIKNLREAARTDGKAAVILMKLTLFRQYYIVVICYIYFTRVVVYALETITSYRYQWTSVVAPELATLAFYVFTGYNFRPKVHNPYFALDDEEKEAAAEALKLEDEFEL
ncbi:hypothetical protein U1Q18_031847 [Sarracenia purpurea var. burkii]